MMAKKNWDKIATKEFKTLYRKAQKDWGELRDRLSRRK